MAQDIDLLTLLPYIDPSSLSYQEWVNVGMGLKEAGYTASEWDSWSQADSRYRPGECEKKWETFHGCSEPVTGGTIVQMAKERGWKPEWSCDDGPGYELQWNDIIGSRDRIVVDTGWLEGEEFHEPGSEWSPVADLTKYLETLFDADENVGYVTESWERDGRFMPSKGCCDRTAGELIQLLAKYGEVGAAFGDCNPEVGAWIRFNPLDGKLVLDGKFARMT